MYNTFLYKKIQRNPLDFVLSSLPRQNIEPNIRPTGMGEGIEEMRFCQILENRGRKGPSPTLKKVLFSNFLEPLSYAFLIV